MPVWKDFKDFAVKGNMVDLAVGVIIGGAFGSIINSIVQDVTMPLLNPLMPQGHWRDWVVSPGVKVGNFLSTVINFLIVALVIFLVVKAMNAMQKKEEAAQLVW